MNDELMRRISDALDAPGGIEANEELRAQLEGDAAAAAYALDLEAIDSALSELGEQRAARIDSGPGWEAVASRFEELEDIGDVTAPPMLEGEDPLPEDAVRPVTLELAAATEPARPEAKVIDLAERRSRRALFATLGGLAAAAAVGLGILAGLEINADSESMVAGAAVHPAPGEAAPAAPASGTGAMAEMEMSAEEGADQAAAGALMPAAPMEPAARPEPTLRARRAVARGGRRGVYPMEMDSLLDDAVGGGRGPVASGSGGGGRRGDSAGAGAEPPMTIGDTSSEPSRPQVVNVLVAAERQIRRCMGDTRAPARVRVRVNGASGAIESLTIDPPFHTGPEGRCMVGVIRRLPMPRSSRPMYTVSHVYRPERVAGGSLDAPANAARQRRQRRRSPAREQRPPVVDAYGH